MGKGFILLLAAVPAVLSAQSYEDLIATPDLSRRAAPVQVQPPSPKPTEDPQLNGKEAPKKQPQAEAPAAAREVIIEQPVYVDQVVELTNYITNYLTNYPANTAPLNPPLVLSNTTTVNVSNTVIRNVYTMQPLSPDIFTAVFYGRLNDVRIFIERRVYGPNAIHNDGNTLLHLAVYNAETVNTAAYLIDQGAEINGKNRLGQSPLHVAVLRSNLPAVELLVSRGAALVIKDAIGQTPLWLANITGQGDMLKILAAAFQSREGSVIPQESLKSKGLPNVPSIFDLFNNRYRRLAAQPVSDAVWHQALYRPGLRGAVDLIQRGYNPKDTDINGQNALHIAAFYDNLEAVQYLLSLGVPAASKDKFGETPLHIAAGRSSPELIKLLVDYGGSVLDKNNNGWTPLFEASLLGNIPAAEFFLQKGVSPNTRTKTGRTPLHEAARLGNTDLIIGLIDKGAVLYAADKDGKTPLYLAAEAGKIQAVAQLVNRGAPVDTDTKEGMTPLHIAVRNEYAGLVRYLMETGGADMFIPDNKGRYPLETAYAKGNDELIAYLAGQYTAAQAKVPAAVAAPVALPAQTPPPAPLPAVTAAPAPAPDPEAYGDNYPMYDEADIGDMIEEEYEPLAEEPLEESLEAE